LKPPQLATAIAKLTLTKKAHDVVVMDLRKLSSVTDFFVICSADSDIQVKAIAGAVEEELGKRGVSLWHREAGSLNWFVLDYVDVVLHIFHKTTRSFYNLEKLWGDARIRRMSDDKAPVPARSPRPSGSVRTRASTKRKAS
jgi:ribosome-associated protein